ncbi:nuclear protein 96 [Pycnococcus provasolii]
MDASSAKPWRAPPPALTQTLHEAMGVDTESYMLDRASLFAAPMDDDDDDDDDDDAHDDARNANKYKETAEWAMAPAPESTPTPKHAHTHLPPPTDGEPTHVAAKRAAAVCARYLAGADERTVPASAPPACPLLSSDVFPVTAAECRDTADVGRMLGASFRVGFGPGGRIAMPALAAHKSTSSNERVSKVAMGRLAHDRGDAETVSRLLDAHLACSVPREGEHGRIEEEPTKSSQPPARDYECGRARWSAVNGEAIAIASALLGPNADGSTNLRKRKSLGIEAIASFAQANADAPAAHAVATLSLLSTLYGASAMGPATAAAMSKATPQLSPQQQSLPWRDNNDGDGDGDAAMDDDEPGALVPIENDGGAGAGAGDAAEKDEADANLSACASLARGAVFGRWLRRRLAGALDNSPSPDAQALLSLLKRRPMAAIAHLTTSRDTKLAALAAAMCGDMSRAGSDDSSSRALMREQVAVWDDEGCTRQMDARRHAMYLLLSGDVAEGLRVAEMALGIGSLGWLCHVACHYWYGSGGLLNSPPTSMDALFAADAVAHPLGAALDGVASAEHAPPAHPPAGPVDALTRNDGWTHGGCDAQFAYMSASVADDMTSLRAWLTTAMAARGRGPKALALTAWVEHTALRSLDSEVIMHRWRRIMRPDIYTDADESTFVPTRRICPCPFEREIEVPLSLEWRRCSGPGEISAWDDPVERHAYTCAVSRLHRDAAAECENLRLPFQAIYIALHHPDAAVGAHVARDVLHRSVADWYPSLASVLAPSRLYSHGTQAEDPEAEAKASQAVHFLVHVLGVPLSWLMEACADWMRSEQKPVRELHFHILAKARDGVRGRRMDALFRDVVAPRLLLANRHVDVLRFAIALRTSRAESATTTFNFFSDADSDALRPSAHIEEAYLAHQALRRATAPTQAARMRLAAEWRTASAWAAHAPGDDTAMEVSVEEDARSPSFIAQTSLELLAATGRLNAACGEAGRLAVAKMARDAVASLFAAIADGGEISVSDLVPVIKAAPLTVTERSHALEKVEDLK